MKHIITEADKATLLQNAIECKSRITIFNKDAKILNILNGVMQIGSLSIDASSDIRRTASFTIKLDSVPDNIEQFVEIWFSYYFVLEIGLYNIQLEEFIWYQQGYYLLTDTSTSYNSADNTLTCNTSDRIAELNGSIKGQVGGDFTILIPVKYEDKERTSDQEADGSQYNVIRDVVTRLVKEKTNFENFIISEIGQFYGLEEYNPDWEGYRLENPLWDKIPYDLCFNAGGTIMDVLSAIRDLYPNYQIYVDIYGNFCFDMIPSCDSDAPALTNDEIQQILISEQVTYDRAAIRNVTEIFGQELEIDRYTESCICRDNTYYLTLENYEGYANEQLIAFKANANNGASVKLRINEYSTLSLFEQYTSQDVAENEIREGQIYVVAYNNKNGRECFYFLGETQPHAICILSNGEAIRTKNGETKEFDDYIKEDFQEEYHCTNICVRTDPQSNLAVQRLGILLDVKSGQEFENIRSNSVAMENAKYYNAKSSVMNDTVSITTKLIPFLDVQQKVEYQKCNGSIPYTYITRSISHDFESGTSTITMYRFYPLYD